MVKKMQILIVDAQGGGIGKQLVSDVKQAAPSAEVTAVGANSAATAAMMKAGADHVATGECSCGSLPEGGYYHGTCRNRDCRFHVG